MSYPFQVGSEYRRRDIYRIIGVSENTKGGTWDTGYASHEGDYFIFANIGTPGRTGHDYENRWIGEDLYWYAKNGTRVNQPTIRAITDSTRNVYIFWRDNSDGPFRFAGLGRAKKVIDTSPVEVLWALHPVVVADGTISQ
jgi:5-methylcytosine-specific restriction protein A